MILAPRPVIEGRGWGSELSGRWSICGDGPALSVHVETGVAGALAHLGHRLRFRVSEGWFLVRGGAVEAELRADSLRVVGVLRSGGRCDEGAPSAGDRRRIEAIVAERVLGAVRWPVIGYRGTIVRSAVDAEHAEVRGRLALRGTDEALGLQVTSRPGGVRSEQVFRQSDWGMTPYATLAGQLRVADEIRVIVEAVGRREQGAC